MKRGLGDVTTALSTMDNRKARVGEGAGLCFSEASEAEQKVKAGSSMGRSCELCQGGFIGGEQRGCCV